MFSRSHAATDQFGLKSDVKPEEFGKVILLPEPHCNRQNDTLKPLAELAEVFDEAKLVMPDKTQDNETSALAKVVLPTV